MIQKTILYTVIMDDLIRYEREPETFEKLNIAALAQTIAVGLSFGLEEQLQHRRVYGFLEQQIDKMEELVNPEDCQALKEFYHNSQQMK